MSQKPQGKYFAIAVFTLLIFSSITGYSQRYSDTYQGSLSTESTFSTGFCYLKKDSVPRAHSPRKATIMSAVVPGLGQAYNRKYWKMGIIYAGFAGLTYGFIYNNDSMQSYQKALDYRVDGDTLTIDNKYPFLSDNKVKSERDYYRSNRDRIILGFVALYALQIIDANVDAHLREFEINPDLSMKLKPRLNYLPQAGFRPAFGLAFIF